MSKEHYLRLPQNKAIIVCEEDEGMTLSLHVPGGHLLVTIDETDALALWMAINSVMEKQWEEE